MKIKSLNIIAIIILILINIYLATAEISCLEGNCEVGCCIDKDGFQHNKYPKGMCLGKEGGFGEGSCKNMPTCITQ